MATDSEQLLRDAEVAFRVAPTEATQATVIAAAVELLRRGFDGHNLAILAGEDRSNHHEVRRYLDMTVRELGLEPLTREQAGLARIRQLAEQLVAGDIDPRRSAAGIWEAFLASQSNDREVMRIAVLADAFDDGFETWGPSVDEYVTAARAFLGRSPTRLT